ncbi:MAG: hypothetical protein V7754_22590 [Halioglobus sp.]
MDNEVKEELATLKAQLQKLEQARVRRETPVPASQPIIEAVAATGEAREEDEDWLEDLEGLEPEQILERLKEGLGEWFDELNKELKDTKPSTVLTIFGLGVLVGRLTN